MVGFFMRYKPLNPWAIDFDLLISMKVKSDGAVGVPIYDFLLKSNEQIYYLNHSFMRDKPSNLNEIDFWPFKVKSDGVDLLISMKVKSDGAVGVPIYDFLSKSNEQIYYLNHSFMREKPSNLNEIDFWPFKVKSDGEVPHIWILLVV